MFVNNSVTQTLPCFYTFSFSTLPPSLPLTWILLKEQEKEFSFEIKKKY